MMCAHHNRLLLASVSSSLHSILRSGGLQALTCQTQQCSSRSSNSSSSNSSDGKSDDPLAEFQQKVAALQGNRPEASLQALKNAAGSSSTSFAAAGASSQAGQSSSMDTDSSAGGDPNSAAASSSGQQAASLFSERYGYAVLGGVNPEASQQEAGAQQPKLHPTRDFRHGELYDAADLSPLAGEEQEAWLPRQRKGRRPHRVPAVDLQRLDGKNVDLLLSFVSDSGRLLPRRATGLRPTLQARAARTVKLARQMALLPYEMRVGDGGEGDRWRRMREVEAAQRSSSGSSSSRAAPR